MSPWTLGGSKMLGKVQKVWFEAKFFKQLTWTERTIWWNGWIWGGYGWILFSCSVCRVKGRSSKQSQPALQEATTQCLAFFRRTSVWWRNWLTADVGSEIIMTSYKFHQVSLGRLRIWLCLVDLHMPWSQLFVENSEDRTHMSFNHSRGKDR